jgi:hypothetical protein
MRLFFARILSRSCQWWILLSTVLVCLIEISLSAPTDPEGYWNILRFNTHTNILNQKNPNFKVAHIQSWQFTRFREVNICYQQFKIEHNEYYYANDRTQYRTVSRNKPESSTVVHLQSFGVLSWNNLVSAAKESDFINSYFYLLFRHYCKSKARFPEPVLQDHTRQPIRTTHIKVLERVSLYLQNFFSKEIYFVPIDTTVDEMDDAVKRYKRSPKAVDIESGLLVNAFLEYCEQVRSDVQLQENKVSVIDEAFSKLLDGLDDVRNEKIPKINRQYLEQRFPTNITHNTARVNRDMVRHIYKDYSNPEYFTGPARIGPFDVMIIFINNFEAAHDMCTSSSSPGLDKLTAELNECLKQLFVGSEHGVSLLSQYRNVSLCPGMYRQASSTLLTLHQDAKGILSMTQISDFKSYYMNSLVRCETMIGKLRPSDWPSCELRDFKHSLTPIRPLQKSTQTAIADIQSALTNVMMYDEQYIDLWLMLWVMHGWAKTTTSIGTRANVQEYVKQYLNYYTNMKLDHLMESNGKLPDIIEARGQKVRPTTVTTANRSESNIIEPSRAGKGKSSRQKRSALKKTSTEIRASQDQSRDDESDDRSARTSHTQISNHATQDRMDVTMVQNINSSLSKSPADTDITKSNISPYTEAEKFSGLSQSTNIRTHAGITLSDETEYGTLSDRLGGPQSASHFREIQDSHIRESTTKNVNWYTLKMSPGIQKNPETWFKQRTETNDANESMRPQSTGLATVPYSNGAVDISEDEINPSSHDNFERNLLNEIVDINPGEKIVGLTDDMTQPFRQMPARRQFQLSHQLGAQPMKTARDRHIGSGNLNDGQIEHVKQIPANDLNSEHLITAVSGRAGNSGLKQSHAGEHGSIRKTGPKIYQPINKSKWHETTGLDPNPTATAVGIDSGLGYLGSAQEQRPPTADVRTNRSKLEGDLHCLISHPYST